MNSQTREININTTVPSTLSKVLLATRDYLAGSLAGIFQVIVGQPFDIVKVRLAISDVSNHKVSTVCKDIMKNEGILGFYKGSLPPFIGAPFIYMVQFGVFEKAKQYFREKSQTNSPNLSIKEIAMSGVIANIFSSLVQVPIDHVRIKQQGTVCTASSIDMYFDIFRQKGISGLYKGLMSTFYRQIPGGIIYFGSYESSGRYLKSILNKNEYFTKLAQFIAGGTAGFLYWFTIYPLDNLKTRIQADSVINPKYKNYIDCCRKTVKACGFFGLYKGMQPTLLRAIPVNAASFLIFEQTKLVMNQLAKLAY